MSLENIRKLQFVSPVCIFESSLLLSPGSIFHGPPCITQHHWDITAKRTKLFLNKRLRHQQKNFSSAMHSSQQRATGFCGSSRAKVSSTQHFQCNYTFLATAFLCAASFSKGTQRKWQIYNRLLAFPQFPLVLQNGNPDTVLVWHSKKWPFLPLVTKGLFAMHF